MPYLNRKMVVKSMLKLVCLDISISYSTLSTLRLQGEEHEHAREVEDYEGYTSTQNHCPTTKNASVEGKKHPLGSPDDWGHKPVRTLPLRLP